MSTESFTGTFTGCAGCCGGTPPCASDGDPCVVDADCCGEDSLCVNIGGGDFRCQNCNQDDATACLGCGPTTTPCSDFCLGNYDTNGDDNVDLSDFSILATECGW